MARVAADHAARMQTEQMQVARMQAEQDEQDAIRLCSKQVAWMAASGL